MRYQHLTSGGVLLDEYEPGRVFKIGDKEYVLSENYTLDIPYTNMYHKVQKSERLAAGYTMEQYERAYRQAFLDAARKADPKWEIGKPVPSGALDGITRESVESTLANSGSGFVKKSIDVSI